MKWNFLDGHDIYVDVALIKQTCFNALRAKEMDRYF